MGSNPTAQTTLARGVREGCPPFARIMSAESDASTTEGPELVNRLVNQNVSMKGSGDLVGVTLTPFAYAGAYTYEIDDLGGTTLASGNLTVTP